MKFKLSLKILTLFLLTGLLSNCSKEDKSSFATSIVKDEQGYSYESVENDPTGLRLYTLDNGLKVYLSQNKDEPKIQTYVAVRAGSNYDPVESTGLAHYLEHMLFKGTSEFGTLNWEKEKVYLDTIYNLYEQHRAEADTEKKKEIYREIDRVSLEASKYSIANEYDKLVASLGAQGTNAHTWFEETVYQNEIPSNELNKWAKVESDRFSELVLRLFHTELEAVYEEFNRGQDSDFRKKFQKMMELLFPNHPYGQQTTIGTSAHLKNPSLVDIRNYFEKYYVPNNMAVVLVGDLEFDSTIKLIDETFGKFEQKEVDHPELPKEAPLSEPVEGEVYGPNAESVYLAFRSSGIGSEEEKLVTLIDMILMNSQAGLFDINLNQKQAVQRASSSTVFQNDYGVHLMDGYPKTGQSLEEVRDLMLGEIEKIKNGDFEDWMIQAVINDLKLSQLRRFENKTPVASAYYNAFIHRQGWRDRVAMLEEMKSIGKEELVAFASEFYKDNYAVVYKRQGEDKNIVKVENPNITPVEVNREIESDYFNQFKSIEVEALQPVFVDYKSEIGQTRLENGIPVEFIENETNELFSMNIIFDMGSDHNRKLPLAVGYLDYLGTERLSPEQVRKEFYKLGISYGVNTGAERSYVSLSGLKENMEEGLKLLEELWSDPVADQESYDKLVDKILKAREEGKADKGNILWTGLWNYGKYGEQSRLRNIYTAEELRHIDPSELVDIVKDLRNYKQRIFYYGNARDEAIAALNQNHKVAQTLKDYPEPVKYETVETGNKVYFVNFDMVQAELVMLARSGAFDVDKLAASQLFNSYFGGSMASIVFQDLRESKSLAYSAFAGYSNAAKTGEENYTYSYIGTQANKLPQAVDAMMDLMTEMPEVEQLFEAAKTASLKRIASERITKSNIFWTYEGLKRRGIDHDNREEIYAAIENMSLSDLRAFFEANIKGNAYTTLVIGNSSDLELNALKKLGEVEELDIDYLFNYRDTELKQ